MNPLKIYGLCTALIFIFLLSCAFYKKKSELVKLEISFLDYSTIRHNKVALQAQISNLLEKEIHIPELLYWGIKNDPIADFIFEIEKKGLDNKFISFDIPDNYHPLYEKISLIKLNKNEIRKDTSDIAFYYSYNVPKGNYRVRVLYKVSKHNSISDIYSNWVEFAIK